MIKRKKEKIPARFPLPIRYLFPEKKTGKNTGFKQAFIVGFPGKRQPEEYHGD
ncbi:hypothetical protein [Dysgonomonas sp. 521]|uniref:hypothetical protein n=1 Tax=Dysgonomonas sp. 521 TaxID=2302932 RepID=UPI0013D0F79C|nr:hypothetical protein [Dysgonomonas sp. 521]